MTTKLVTCSCGNQCLVDGDSAEQTIRCDHCNCILAVSTALDESASSSKDASPESLPNSAEETLIYEDVVPTAGESAGEDADFSTPKSPPKDMTTVFDSSFELRGGETLEGVPFSDAPTVQIDLGPPRRDSLDRFGNPSSPTGIRSGIEGSRPGSIDLSRRIMPNSNLMKGLPETTDVTDYGINRIIRPHAKGGMGLIQIAYDQFLKREVALKELRPEVIGDESIVQRFIGEAEVTAQLEHPGIIPIHTLELDNKGNPYYTMKLIKGKTFQEAIREYHKNPSPAELKRLVRRLVSVCQTMSFAHDNGVIHRDLKPANIMLSEHGETIVMDWGLAKVYRNPIAGDDTAGSEDQPDNDSADLTVVGAVVGTPAFMSPEQASPGGPEVGPVSDVYSLGAILYVLLTNKPMYSGRATQDVLDKVRRQAPPRPSAIAKSIPAGLEAICLKATARAIPDRYQNARELMQDLCHWLDGEPVNALPMSGLEKMIYWVQKRSIFVFSGVTTVVLALVLAALLMQLNTPAGRQETVTTKTNAAVALGDLTESGKSFYRLVPSPDHSAMLREDYRMRREGNLSLQLRFTDPGVACIAFLPPEPSRPWDLTQCNSLRLSLHDNPSGKDGLTDVIVRLGQGSNFYEYRVSEQLRMWLKKNWFFFDVPLSGQENDGYSRTEIGHPDLSQVDWLEIYFVTAGATAINIDDLRFVRSSSQPAAP